MITAVREELDLRSERGSFQTVLRWYLGNAIEIFLALRKGSVSR